MKITLKRFSILYLLILILIPISNCFSEELNTTIWLNQHPTIKRNIKWTNSTGTLLYESWTAAMKNDLQTYVNQKLNGIDIDFNELPQLIYIGNNNYITNETAWRYYLSYIANSIVVDEFNFVPWKLNELTDLDLDVLFNSNNFVGYDNTVALYRFGNTPASPNFIYNWLENNSLIGTSRYNTICRLIDWCKILFHYGVQSYDDPNLDINYIHWQYSGPPPIERMINGTVRINDPTGLKHWTAGCHGTVEFLHYVLQILNIPVKYLTVAGHALPYFTSESVYLSHGDDPYGFKFVDVRIPISELLIDEQSFNEKFADSLSNKVKLSHIGYRAVELFVEYLAPLYCNYYCEARQNNLSNYQFMESVGLQYFYTEEELNSLNFWNNLNDKINYYGGCANFFDISTFSPPPRNEKAILDLWFYGQYGNAMINENTKTITAQLISSKDIRSVIPHFCLSEGASINYNSGSKIDFTPPKSFQVVAEDNTQNTWTVIITLVDQKPNKPTLLFPENNSTNIPTSITLWWDDPPEDISYHLQISSDASFSNLIFDHNDFDSTSFALFNLSNKKTYYWRVNAKMNYYTSDWSDPYKFTTTDLLQNSVVDVEGNVYNTISIGDQIWMKENLKTIRYNNGQLIGTTIPALWDISFEYKPKYQWAYEGKDSYANIYGRFYTWYAINDSRGVCPIGWHIPSNEEWSTLADFLLNNGYGFEGSGGDIAKSLASMSGWTSSDIIGTVGNDQVSNNSSNFTILPGGYRNGIGYFSNIGDYAYLWSSTEYSNTGYYIRIISYLSNYFSPGIWNVMAKDAMSIRCIKDIITSITNIKSIPKIRIFPNPVTTFLSIQYNNNEIGDFKSLNIYDILGNFIYTEKVKMPEQFIDFSNYESGLYVLEFLKFSGEAQRYKIIKK